MVLKKQLIGIRKIKIIDKRMILNNDYWKINNS